MAGDNKVFTVPLEPQFFVDNLALGNMDIHGGEVCMVGADYGNERTVSLPGSANVGIDGGYLLLGKKFRAAGKFLAGVVIGYSPLIIFELRNNFYNIKIIWGWLTHGTGNNDFLTEHYFLWLYLIIFTLIYYLVERKFKKITVGLVTVVVLAWILAVVAEKKITGNWIAVDYPTINKISGMITSGGCPKNFEVASTAEGDSRFYSLRYLLTEKGCPPMGVEDYPKTERLFLLAAADRPVEKETIWEVTSMGEIEVVKEEKVGNNFVFYELQKAVH